MMALNLFQLFRGEWLKIAGNRWVVIFLIWIFPAAMLLVGVAAILFALLTEDFREAQRLTGVAPWNESLLSTWDIVNNQIGRWVILAFTANIFAGEYTHGTWKNLIIHRRRVTLIINKFVTLAVFVTAAFVAVSIINGIASGILASILDIDYGLSNAGAVMGEFIKDYLLQMFITLTGTFIVASFAALAAMITRNVLASVIVGVIINMVETVGVVFFFGLVDWLLKINLFELYRYLPTYSLENINSWIGFSRGLDTSFAGQEYIAPSLEMSLLVVVLWAFGLVALTAYLFQRQDISS